MDEHVPVLVHEVLAAMAVRPDGYYVDATFGRGGHTALILDALGPQGRLLALDRDPEAIAAGSARFGTDPRLILKHAAFAGLRELVPACSGGRPCGAILLDLGVSSAQLETPERGFSFRADGPLDMRMDPTAGEPVSAWLARAPLEEIQDVIATLGEERFARRVARAIVDARAKAPLTRTGQLATLVAGAVKTREPGKHPATRTFQALRMYINDELGQLEQGLAGALEGLAPGGRLVVISFHSLEDRLVKRFMRQASQIDPELARLPFVPPAQAPRLRLSGLPPAKGHKLRPTPEEVERNPRARSALLRVAEKVW